MQPWLQISRHWMLDYIYHYYLLYLLLLININQNSNQRNWNAGLGWNITKLKLCLCSCSWCVQPRILGNARVIPVQIMMTASRHDGSVMAILSVLMVMMKTTAVSYICVWCICIFKHYAHAIANFKYILHICNFVLMTWDFWTFSAY